MDFTDKQVEALCWAFRVAEIELDNLVEAMKKICEAVVICYVDFEAAMERVAELARADPEQVAREMEELAELAEKAERLDLQAKRERKERWERRRIAERANAARFSQYKARELSWKRRKRTRPRWREWRGADRT